MRNLDTKTVDRFVDLASVTLISVAAVLTAVCGYQASRWDGEQTRLYNIAAATRLQAEQAADSALVYMSINVTLFLNYIEAMQKDDRELSQYIYQRLGPRFRPVMDAWLATHPWTNPRAPSSPFVMPQYTRSMNAAARKDQAVADADFAAAIAAHRNADEFTLLTVIFATVSFLAGMSTKMSYPRHLIIVALGILALVYGLGRFFFLPVL